MSPEEKELLRRSLALSEENNKILLKVQKSLKWQAIWSVIKILVVVVPLIVGYLLFQPYLGSMFNTYKEVQGMINNPEDPSAPSTQNQSSTSGYFSNFLNQIK